MNVRPIHIAVDLSGDDISPVRPRMPFGPEPADPTTIDDLEVGDGTLLIVIPPSLHYTEARAWLLAEAGVLRIAYATMPEELAASVKEAMDILRDAQDGQDG